MEYPITLTRGESVTTFTVTGPGPVVLVERTGENVITYQFSSPWADDVDRRVTARITLLERDGWKVA